MTLSELKIGTTVEVNSWDYEYQGIKKDEDGFDNYYFYSEKLKSPKYFLVSKTAKKELKIKKGKFVL